MAAPGVLNHYSIKRFPSMVLPAHWTDSKKWPRRHELFDKCHSFSEWYNYLQGLATCHLGEAASAMSMAYLIVWVQANSCTSALTKNAPAVQSWASFTTVMRSTQRSPWSKGKTQEVPFCIRRTHRPKERRVNFMKKRQQIHSSYRQGLLNLASR